MSVYFITGALGSGKSLAAIGKIRDALLAGKRVATNMDVMPEKMLPAGNRNTLLRLPDKPRLCDLQAAGYGCDERDYTEKKFGLMVFDELASWFNTRSWNDKERLPVIEWFLHARKMRWHVLFLVQDMEAIDKQLRTALCEHYVRVRRLDRFMIPIVGQVAKFVGINLRMPQVHVASVYYGETPDPTMHVERWWYRGTDLYDGYDTGQVFASGQELLGDALVDMRAPYSVLSAWHVLGRYPKPKQCVWCELARWRVALPIVAIAYAVAVLIRVPVGELLIRSGVARRRTVVSSGGMGVKI